MNVLVVPMFALSRMGGPWSRAQAIASAFEQAGHRVMLGVADDDNCLEPCVADLLKLPTPSPLGLPMAVASKTFPLAEKLGVSGRKPVRSFEEVLWLTGALAYQYEKESVRALCDAIATHRIDAVYSEYSLPAIIAARALDVPVFGSFSFTTQTSYASDPKKAAGVRKLLDELELPAVESSLELFEWLDCRFVPSCRELEPIAEEDADSLRPCEFVGFLQEPPGLRQRVRDFIVVYLGAGSVPQRRIERVVSKAFRDFDCIAYAAGSKEERGVGNVLFAPRFDFSRVLPRARCFVHHGGQNSTMDALAYGAPQVIVPGRVFERIYNAKSIERVGAGLMLESFTPEALAEACRRVAGDLSFAESATTVRNQLAKAGGAQRIVSVVEEAVYRKRYGT